MPNDIYFRNHHEPISRPLPFAVFAAVYSGAPLFFAVFARCFSLLFRMAAPSKTEEICGFGANRRCIFLE